MNAVQTQIKPINAENQLNEGIIWLFQKQNPFKKGQWKWNLENNMEMKLMKINIKTQIILGKKDNQLPKYFIQQMKIIQTKESIT